MKLHTDNPIIWGIITTEKKLWKLQKLINLNSVKPKMLNSKYMGEKITLNKICLRNQRFSQW